MQPKSVLACYHIYSLVQIDHKGPGTIFRRRHVPWPVCMTSNQCIVNPPKGGRRRHCLQPIEFAPQYGF